MTKKSVTGKVRPGMEIVGGEKGEKYRENCGREKGVK